MFRKRRLSYVLTIPIRMGGVALWAHLNVDDCFETSRGADCNAESASRGASAKCCRTAVP